MLRLEILFVAVPLGVRLGPTAPPTDTVDTIESAGARAPESAEDVTRAAVDQPWRLLTGKRLGVAKRDGSYAEGVLLGVEDGNAILEAADGSLIAIPDVEVASVRILKESPAKATQEPPPPVPPKPAEDLDTAGETAVEARATLTQADRDRILRYRGRARIGVGIGGALSMGAFVSTVVAEAQNIHMWSETSYVCGEDFGEEVCGWTDTHSQIPYDVVAAMGVGLGLHLMAGPTMLVPTGRLRRELGSRSSRGRHIASWVLWGVGTVNLLAGTTVAGLNSGSEQLFDCNPPDVLISPPLQDPDECPNGAEVSGDGPEPYVRVYRDRGLPPGVGFVTAGLVLASTILAIADYARLGRESDGARPRGMTTSRTHIGVVPIRHRGGGGVALSGRF